MENYAYYTPAQLRAELEKCYYCAEKPCWEACPSHCSPADFIMAARQENPSDFLRSALEIMKANPFGQVCGIVCPDTFCMDACSRKTFDAPVNIPKIQASVMQRARDLGEVPAPRAPKPNGKTVAILGAGPAGLAAAAVLAQRGYQVDLYDTAKKAGGACWMIPDWRLPKNALKADIDFVLASPLIRTVFGKPTKDPEALLKAGANAVLVSVGEPEAANLDIPGEELAITSLEYLKAPKSYEGAKSVAILGGGAVAADCATTARRNGAGQVEMFVRRTLGEMRLTDFERRMLLEHAIDITTRTRIQKIARAKGKLSLTVTKLTPALKDMSGNSSVRDGFDLVVLAIGSRFSGQKSRSKSVFYAGDCVEGSSTVVEAVASGKNAASRIDHFLTEAPLADFRPGSRSQIKSRVEIPGIAKLPVPLDCDFFGIPISSPFLLSAAPATDGLDQMKRAYEAGWAGAVMKTAFDNVPIHIPANYMVTFGRTTHGNCDNVSGHSLDRVCRELKDIRKLYPDRLTLASTGGPVTGHDESDRAVWQSNTKKLEAAGALGVEYSLSCPQGGDGTEGDIVSQNAALTAKIIDWVLQVSDPGNPKLFKLTAAVTSLKPILAAIEQVFAKYPNKKAGVTLANSFPVLAFRKEGQGADPSYQGPWTEAVVVGMSGDGVFPLSTLALANAAQFKVPVSGNGGVMNYESAAHFLALGARTVQVCTVATHFGLGIIHELNSGLSHFLHARGMKSVKDLIGVATAQPIRGFNELSATKQVSQVKAALCQSCGNCTRCPYLAITLDSKKHPVTDPARCVGCSICVKSCWAGALFMRDRSARELEMLEE